MINIKNPKVGYKIKLFNSLEIIATVVIIINIIAIIAHINNNVYSRFNILFVSII